MEIGATPTYRLRVRTTFSGPEVASPAYTVGDTIGGEALEVEFDEDRFEFDVLTGQRLQFSFQVAAACAIPLGRFRLHLAIRAATSSGSYPAEQMARRVARSSSRRPAAIPSASPLSRTRRQPVAPAHIRS
jgi:hypothetical protein